MWVRVCTYPRVGAHQAWGSSVDVTPIVREEESSSTGERRCEFRTVSLLETSLRSGQPLFSRYQVVVHLVAGKVVVTTLVKSWHATDPID